ncbi:MAG: right-handed parallel beta-helix repeat-containing protein [Promethearchaeota archaeon]
MIKIKNKKIAYSEVNLLLLMCGFLLAMLFSSPIVIQDAEDYSNPKSSDGEITVSRDWNMTGSPIIIDDDSDWVYYATNYEWCSGNGTWNDPYLIEDVFIDALNSGNGITIKNTVKYFIITNCTLINSGTSYTDNVRNSGINLISTKNGLLTNNSLSGNQHGIFLKYCNDNVTVRQNNISNNRQEGIFQWECSKIDYINNTITFNQNSGIYWKYYS